MWLNTRLWIRAPRASSPRACGGVCSVYKIAGEPGGSRTRLLNTSKSLPLAMVRSHGDAPAVIYRIDYTGKSITFSGDIDAKGLAGASPHSESSREIIRDGPTCPAQLLESSSGRPRPSWWERSRLFGHRIAKGFRHASITLLQPAGRRTPRPAGLWRLESNGRYL